jgi:hypothetical protein
MLPIALRETKPGLIPNEFIIPACKDPMKDVEIVHIARARFPVYIDENRPALVVPEPSDLLAQAICRDFKVSVSHLQPGVAEPGIFWLRGQYLKAEILDFSDKKITTLVDKNRDMQTTWFKSLVKAADDDWSRFHIRKMISDLQVLAVKALGIEREYDIAMEIGLSKTKPCKFCRADIHPEAIICMHCRGVVDMDRFKKEFQAVPTASA